MWSSGAIISTIELDPWGADTNRSSNAAFQPKKFTSYERDANGSDEAMFRRYNRWHSRFDQPDPYEGSYDLGDPQTFNRYAYVQNDPVNFVDPSGLNDEPVDGYLVTDTLEQGMGWGYWRSLFFSPSGGGWDRGAGDSGGGDPQNPEVRLTQDQLKAVRNGIETQLTDKCAEFINQLVSSVTGKPYDAKKSLLTDFDAVRDGGGFFFGGTIHGGDASLAAKKVNINSMYSKNVGANAIVFLHEIIHIVAQAIDQPLSAAVRDLGITVVGYPGYIVPYPTDANNINLAYSRYFGQALINACTARGH